MNFQEWLSKEYPIQHTRENITTINFQGSENNFLEGSADFNMFPKLSHLSLSHHQLSFINLTNNKNLTSLDLSHNNLQDLDLSGNKLLKTLKASSNKIRQISFIHNQYLKNIDLSKNSLTNLDLMHFKNLKTLDISDNGSYFHLRYLDPYQKNNLTLIRKGIKKLSSKTKPLPSFTSTFKP